MNKRKKLWLFGSLSLIIAVVVSLVSSAGKKKAQAITCGNHMISICFVATHLWAEDNAGFLPTKLNEMSNEIGTLKILLCPSDLSRRAPANWDALTSDNTSYEMVTTGLRAGDTNGVFLRCKVHGFIGYADGSVYDGKGKLKKW